LDEKQHGLLIDRIVQEVLHRISAIEANDEDVSGTVVLMTSNVPSPGSAISTLKRNFGEDMLFVNFGTKNPFALESVTDAGAEDENRIVEIVAKAANVALLAPKVGLLEKISGGRDEDFVPHLVIRSLLWGRKVSAVLDFDPPRFRRNTFYERLADIIASLEDMGVKIITYKCAAQKENGLALVTEADVMDAWKNRQKEIRCAAGAIITPSARDKMQELGIRRN
jgi:hypothetical protein